jgi:hypothetical protein
MSTLDQLRKYLPGVGHGRLREAEIREVECQLSGCWSDLQGSGNGGMTADKLVGRTEAMEWNRPTLTFKIERHGALMEVSSRAELQTWEIDVVRGIATLVAATGRRQIYPMAARLDVKPIAAEIAAPDLAPGVRAPGAIRLPIDQAR